MTGGTDWSALGGDVWATVAAVAAVMLLTFAVALRKGVHRIVDVAWGLAFAAVALTTCGFSAGEGDPTRRALVTALTVVWGLRLAGHIAGRGRGKGEDPRYARMLDKAPGSRNAYALRKVYLLQGALVLVVSLPVQAGQYAHTPPGPLAWAGCAVWLVGMFFETVGDAQLARFTARPENRGTVMDRGLWSWTRHPNYFGGLLRVVGSVPRGGDRRRDGPRGARLPAVDECAADRGQWKAPAGTAHGRAARLRGLRGAHQRLPPPAATADGRRKELTASAPRAGARGAGRGDTTIRPVPPAPPGATGAGAGTPSGPGRRDGGRTAVPRATRARRSGPAADHAGKSTSITGSEVGCGEPPSGSTVTPMPEAPSSFPSSRAASEPEPGCIRPAGRIRPSSLSHSW